MVITSGQIDIAIPSRLYRHIIPYQECEDERIMSGVLETGGPGLAGEDTVLDMGFADAIHGRIVLIATATERKVCSDSRRQVDQVALPG